MKSADSSSAHSMKYSPSKAIDNDKETIFATSGYYEMNPWLQIQLGNISSVHHVIIHNRNDCCGDRMKNVTLRVAFTKFVKGMNLNDAEICGTYRGPGKNGDEISISCNGSIKGQYVSIHLMQDTPALLNLNEIMIYGIEGK